MINDSPEAFETAYAALLKQLAEACGTGQAPTQRRLSEISFLEGFSESCSQSMVNPSAADSERGGLPPRLKDLDEGWEFNIPFAGPLQPELTRFIDSLFRTIGDAENIVVMNQKFSIPNFTAEGGISKTGRFLSSKTPKASMGKFINGISHFTNLMTEKTHLEYFAATMNAADMLTRLDQGIKVFPVVKALDTAVNSASALPTPVFELKLQGIPKHVKEALEQKLSGDMVDVKTPSKNTRNRASGQSVSGHDRYEIVLKIPAHHAQQTITALQEITSRLGRSGR